MITFFHMWWAACACAQLKEQHTYAWLGVVCRNVLIKVKLVHAAIWEPLSQLLRKCTSEGFDLSKPAQIRTWMTTNWTHKPCWINTISESTELQTFIKLTRKKQTTKLTIIFFNTQKLHKPQKLGLSVRPHQSGCSQRRRRSSLAAEVTTPCIDPGSRPRAATRLHYSICVQSASLLGAKLISLHDHKMNEVTE